MTALIVRARGSSLAHPTVADASKDDPAEYKRLNRQIGTLNPDRLDILANYLVERGEKKEAAAIYEEFATRARDRVGMCNSMGWLVNYYEDLGKKERALALAQEAAQVYCGEGLLTLADLYERRQQWKDAEDFHRRYAERYGEEWILLGFYIRHQQRADAKPDARLDDTKRRELLAKFFPKGLETAGPDPVAPPGDGVILVGNSEEAGKATLQRGDVIVALNGFQVHSYYQYRVIRNLNHDPELKLTLWRGQALHLSARPQNRWFGVEVKSHHGAEANERLYL